MIVNALVEGILDEAIAARVLTFAGHTLGTCYGKRGWQYIQQKIGGFAQLAQLGQPILTLVDFMDTGYACPPELIRQWLPQPAPNLLLRAVVRESESWLLADRNGMAAFLSVASAQLPRDPEREPDPKQTLVNLARRSHQREILRNLVPQPNSSAAIGAGYVAMLSGFVRNQWDIAAAQTFAPSLARCIARLNALHSTENHLPIL
ncbi:MAG: hypothetical protein OHK0052_07560 [Anaerolineales bacterium]